MYPVGAATKKRRLQGACDLCRSKKGKQLLTCNLLFLTVPPRKYDVGTRVRISLWLIGVAYAGDSATMPGNVCSNCISFGSTCTHTMGKRGKVQDNPINTLDPH